MQVLEGVIPRYSLEKRFKHKKGYLVWCALTVSLVRDGQRTTSMVPVFS